MIRNNDKDWTETVVWFDSIGWFQVYRFRRSTTAQGGVRGEKSLRTSGNRQVQHNLQLLYPHKCSVVRSVLFLELSLCVLLRSQNSPNVKDDTCSHAPKSKLTVCFALPPNMTYDLFPLTASVSILIQLWVIGQTSYHDVNGGKANTQFWVYRCNSSDWTFRWTQKRAACECCQSSTRRSKRI